MEKILTIVAVAFFIVLAFFIQTNNHTVSAELKYVDEALDIPQPIQTKSEFSTALETRVTKLPFQTKYKDNPEIEAGIEQVIEEGEEGILTEVIKTTLHLGKPYSKEVMSTDKKSPKDKVIARGTKIIWRELEIPEGKKIRYWKKLRVWATHYDSRCRGCNEITATGLKAGKGVIAVDPKVIKLGSSVYIPGYGEAIAGDTGGAIKGNIIDLGFEDARTSGWRAKFVDIYLTE